MTYLRGFFSHSDPESLEPDIRVEDHLSLFLVRPFSERGESWIRENITQDSAWFGDALVVEPRYVGALLTGMIVDGLTLMGGRGRAAQ